MEQRSKDQSKLHRYTLEVAREQKDDHAIQLLKSINPKKMSWADTTFCEVFLETHGRGVEATETNARG